MQTIEHSLRVALFQPDIPGNTGTILRTAACLGFAVDIIEPAGFDMSDRALRRAGLDYTETSLLKRHQNWERFLDDTRNKGHRLILATTKAASNYQTFTFHPNDILLFGRESSGAPDYVHDAADAAIKIEMQKGKRSLNLAVSVGILTASALASFQ